MLEMIARTVKPAFQTRQLLALALGAISLFGTSAIHADEPDAGEILKTARIANRNIQQSLKAQLRIKDRKDPFILSLDRGTLSYRFENPPQTFVVQLGENSAQLTEGHGKTITAKRFDEKLRSTDLTLEDISLRFLYWPDATVVGSELFRSQMCWKLELKPATTPSQYKRMEAWIQKDSGALLKAIGYGDTDKPAIQFRVISARKLKDDTWMLKQMSIERMENGKLKDSTPTYLEILSDAE